VNRWAGEKNVALNGRVKKNYYFHSRYGGPVSGGSRAAIILSTGNENNCEIIKICNAMLHQVYFLRKEVLLLLIPEIW